MSVIASFLPCGRSKASSLLGYALVLGLPSLS